MVQCQVAQHTCLNLYLLDIHLPFHLVASLQLDLRQNARLVEHLDHLRAQVVVKDARHRCLAVQAAACSLCLPSIAIAVAVKVNRASLLEQVFHLGENGIILVHPFGHTAVNGGTEPHQLLCYCGVERKHRRGAVGARTHGTELKAVAGKRKRRRTVAVGVVDHQFGYLAHLQVQTGT